MYTRREIMKRAAAIPLVLTATTVLAADVNDCVELHRRLGGVLNCYCRRAAKTFG